MELGIRTSKFVFNYDSGQTVSILELLFLGWASSDAVSSPWLCFPVCCLSLWQLPRATVKVWRRKWTQYWIVLRVFVPKSLDVLSAVVLGLLISGKSEG